MSSLPEPMVECEFYSARLTLHKVRSFGDVGGLARYDGWHLKLLSFFQGKTPHIHLARREAF